MKGGTDKFPVIVGDHRECSEGVGLLRRRHKSVSAAAPDLKNIPMNGRRSLTPFTRATDLRGLAVETDQPNVHINSESDR